MHIFSFFLLSPLPNDENWNVECLTIKASSPRGQGFHAEDKAFNTRHRWVLRRSDWTPEGPGGRWIQKFHVWKLGCSISSFGMFLRGWVTLAFPEVCFTGDAEWG